MNNYNQQSTTTPIADTARRLIGSLCLSAGMLLASSCIGNIGGRTASHDPFLQPDNSTAPAKPAPAVHEQTRVAALPPELQRQPSADDGGVIEQASFSAQPQQAVVRLAEWQVPAHKANSSQTVTLASHTIPSTARVDVTPVAYQQRDTPQVEYNISDVDRFEDEYLLDGGDRALPIHYSRIHRMGVDTEDTIAEYSDHLGEQHVKPTNRVAIYAPRFGAVRTVTGPGAGTSVELFALKTDTSRMAGLRNRRTPLNRTQHDSAGRIDVRSRPSGVESGANGESLHQSTTLILHVKPIKAAEDLQFVGSGRFLQTERARLATGIQAAAVWTRKQSPVILAKDDGLQELYSWFKPQELVGLSDEKTPGELRIVKLADKKVAKPGDVVTFTIRYDNLGDRELNNIRIIDNLTPRLEYVDDSATSDRKGRLDVEDNGEGSLVLKFFVDDPLPGHQGGIVTFKALVR